MNCPKCKSLDFIGIYGKHYTWEIVEYFCLKCGYTKKIETSSS